jgi:uncharacterized protein with PQ loop repeat
MTLLSWIGWIATAVFSTSYFFKRADTLRWIQAGAALLWVTYGLLIHAMPVVVANIIVAAAALYSWYAAARAERRSRNFRRIDDDSLEESIS